MTAKHHPVTALVVAEDELVRLGLRLLLRNMTFVRDVVQAQGRYDALKLAETVDYDVVVLDLSRPDAAGGAAVIDDLAAVRPDAPFVIYTDDPLGAARFCHDKRLRCACAARGPTSAADLSLGIEAVLSHANGSAADPRAPGNDGATREANHVASLTPRERNVLSLVASGKSSREIAAPLGVSTRTVESHRSGVCTKLGVRTVAGLTKIAVKAGLTSLDHPTAR